MCWAPGSCLHIVADYYRATSHLTARLANRCSFAFAWPLPPCPIYRYPQTGASILLPLHYSDNYQRMVLMKAGGSVVEKANSQTPASNQAHFIEVRAAGPRGCGSLLIWQPPVYDPSLEHHPCFCRGSQTDSRVHKLLTFWLPLPPPLPRS